MPESLFFSAPPQVFSCEFCEIYKNNFLTEHLWATAPENSNKTVLDDIILLQEYSLILQGKICQGKHFPRDNNLDVIIKKNIICV